MITYYTPVVFQGGFHNLFLADDFSFCGRALAERCGSQRSVNRKL